MLIMVHQKFQNNYFVIINAKKNDSVPDKKIKGDYTSGYLLRGINNFKFQSYSLLAHVHFS